MKNATIATSRTRATTDLIDYRPLPATWGDIEALHTVRRARARAAEHGLDPSTLDVPETSRPKAPARRMVLGRRHVRHHLAA